VGDACHLIPDTLIKVCDLDLLHKSIGSPKYAQTILNAPSWPS